LGEVERGQLVLSEAEKVRTPDHIVAEQLERQGSRCAEPFEEPCDKLVALTAAGTLQKSERPLVIRRAQRVELADQLCQGIVPADFLELAAPARSHPLERVHEAIGMVGDLNGGLAPRAQRA